ncbi:(2Fe-2S)-binding protein [Sanguibacter suaedae]|uniref:(2Fe-2S)-binding protein n=1 Tax=Sanguibacter suaedae TaxID=2795737 RepID=A0A934I5Z0_9MICO|nr:(2Fe-2S)-binding protein [Sanguibacter suaedae]MBI9116224.1 (2Fe-2S)-binding protein [Sanguibacter suaedae]
MEQHGAPLGTADPLAALRLLLDDSPEDATTVVPLDAESCEALADDHLVCQCNNVSAGEIRRVLADGSCGSLDDVQVLTRAGGGCGHCLPTVAGIVDVELLKVRPL